MIRHEKNTFVSTSVPLDNSEFHQCSFTDCAMVYSGGKPPTLDRCSFQDSKFHFEGAAANTVLFLQEMAKPQSGLQTVAREIFAALNAN